MHCPKCNYQRKSSDTHIHPDVCPSCGVVYSKFLDMHSNAPESTSPQSHSAVTKLKLPLLARLKASLLYVPEEVNETHFWGRCLVFIGLFVWGWSFILGGIDWPSIGGSFMHNINLPFHEFGHIFFSPLGRFMSILGGSLFQVMLPFALAVAFIFFNRDVFAASVMTWWCGQSFIDLSPYIIDASDRSLPLIGGMGEESHDWGNLLSELGWLSYGTGLAKLSFSLGTLLIICSFVWGGYTLVVQKQRLNAHKV